MCDRKEVKRLSEAECKIIIEYGEGGQELFHTREDHTSDICALRLLSHFSSHVSRKSQLVILQE